MVKFKSAIRKFDKKGEKTGWTYIDIPADIAQQIFPGNKKSFRVKGKLDNYSIEKTALLPMGNGDFILPMNSKLRKGTGKKLGATLLIELELDKKPLTIDPDLIECLSDEPEAKDFFQSLPTSHKNYFSKWIESAKTDVTKAKRIAQTVNALYKKRGFAEMIRGLKKQY